MQDIICVAALVLQMLAPYVVWASRWNVPAHINVGFCVTAYIVPGLLTDVWDQVTPQTVDTYMIINCIGAVAITAGIILGASIKPDKKHLTRLGSLFQESANRFTESRAEQLIIIGIVGICLAYAIMGFIPMFAEDPLTAKQFKGEYHEPYYRAAYLFRFSFSTLVACIPLVMVCGWALKHKRPIILGCIAAFLIAISLARASTALGIITFFGFIAAWNRKYFKWYLFVVAILFPLGSAGYLLLGLALGVESLTSIYAVDSVFDIIASGAPDIYDQLTFLEGFLRTDGFTYGRTFFGGLVPGNFTWNPSVWTLTYDNLGADISDTVSGGLRLSVALWGYASFGWIGVILIPLASGIINGYLISLMKRLPFKKSLIGASLTLSLYMTLGKQLVEFYMLSIHAIPSIACILVICFGYPKLFKRKRLKGTTNTAQAT